MSPKEGFWEDVQEKQLLHDQAYNWSRTQFGNNPRFACRLVSQDINLAGVLRVTSRGEGVLKIPTAYRIDYSLQKQEWLYQATASGFNRNQLKLDSSDTISDTIFQKIGLVNKSYKVSDYAGILISSYKEDDSNKGLVFSIFRSDTICNINPSKKNHNYEIAFGVATDLNDTLPGFTLLPVKF